VPSSGTQARGDSLSVGDVVEELSGDAAQLLLVESKAATPSVERVIRASKLLAVRRSWALFLVALALTAMLLTGCGGSNDHAKVEASLRGYLSTIDPQACLGLRYCSQGVFPVGAGPPHVRENSCKKVHEGAWSCVITFAHGRTAQPVDVAVKDGDEVTSAWPVSQAAPLPPATTYEGGPGQSQP
jgi:hypothetical protein